MTGVSYKPPRPKWRGSSAPSPAYAPNAAAHAARHPQPSPRRLRRAKKATKRFPSHPVPLDHALALTDPACSRRAKRAWDDALRSAKRTAYRNAQVSVVAPTGTIGLVMDCDTTGIEPDFALVKFKKLAGGGYFKIINRASPPGAARVRLPESHEIAEIEAYAVGHASLEPGAGTSTTCDPARAKRLHDDKLAALEAALAKSAFDIKFVFNRFDARRRLSCATSSKRHRRRSSTIPPSISCAFLGFSKAEIEAANMPRLRRHDARGRAAPRRPSITPCSIARPPAASTGKRYLSVVERTSG